MKIKKLHLQACVPTILIGILVSMLVSSSFIFMTRQHAPQIVTVHLSDIINRYVKTLVQAKVPAETVRIHMHVFSKKLDEALKALAYQQHAIVLVSEAVATGAQDVTAELEKILKKGEPPHAL
jgi:hypothetical protein